MKIKQQSNESSGNDCILRCEMGLKKLTAIKTKWNGENIYPMGKGKPYDASFMYPTACRNKME